jgi:hypothetical protein
VTLEGSIASATAGVLPLLVPLRPRAWGAGLLRARSWTSGSAAGTCSLMIDNVRYHGVIDPPQRAVATMSFQQSLVLMACDLDHLPSEQNADELSSLWVLTGINDQQFLCVTPRSANTAAVSAERVWYPRMLRRTAPSVLLLRPFIVHVINGVRPLPGVCRPNWCDSACYPIATLSRLSANSCTTSVAEAFDGPDRFR